MSGLANVVTASLTPELDRLTVDIRDEHKAAQRDHLSAVKHAIRCGQLLLEAKAGVSHGAWHIWVADNLKFSDRTAQGYMRLARLDASKAQRVADLSLRQALKDIGQEYGRKQKAIERQVDRELEDEAQPLVLDAEAVRVEDDDVPVQQPATKPEIEANKSKSRINFGEYGAYRDKAVEDAIARCMRTFDSAAGKLVTAQERTRLRDGLVTALEAAP